MAIADKDATDSARVAGYLDMFRNAQGLTGDLREKAFIEGFGGSVPYEFREAETKAELPTIGAILDKLELKDDKKEMKGGKTALDKFLSGMTDRKKRADFKDSIEKAWGPEGWKWTQKAFQDVATDKMNEDIRAGRIMALSGDMEGQGIPEKVGGMAMKFFTPRRYEAFAEGRDPTWKDNLGDIAETGMMSVPAGQYARILGAVPKAGKILAGNRAVTNVFGNAVAPFASEVMDAAMRGDDDPNTERQDFSLGDALMGMATNLGVNFGLARSGGGAGRVATGELAKSSEGGIVRKVREQIGDFGKTRAERGLAAPTSKAGYIMQAAEMGAPTLIVNRYGKDKDANYALNMAGGALAAVDGPNVAQTVKEVREKEHQEPKDRKTKKQVEAVKGTTIGLTPRDEKYLQAVADDPSIVTVGYAADPDDFKLWLLERGHDLLKGTGAHRPLWEIEP
ncbi:MAG: hypothetical protein II207_02620 [Clostridia bacterium]|nr:hypothetical protein [Clostridia bacterium]